MPETPQACAILVLMRLDFLSPTQEVGFDPVEETVSFATPSGAITLFRAQKNTGDPT